MKHVAFAGTCLAMMVAAGNLRAQAPCRPCP